MTQKEMLEELQRISFFLVDLNLYLDTHPDCEQALALYNTYFKRQHDLRKEYEAAYGPLLNWGNMPAGKTFNWIDSPWPWEN